MPHNLPELLGQFIALGIAQADGSPPNGLFDFSISKLAALCSLPVPACPGDPSVVWGRVASPTLFPFHSQPQESKSRDRADVHSTAGPVRGVEPGLTFELQLQVSEMGALHRAFKGVASGFRAHRCQPNGAGRDASRLSDNRHSK